MHKSRFLFCLLLAGVMLLMIGGITFVTFGQEEEPAVPEIPGITVEDIKPQGCVDCHLQVSPESDYRLSTELIELAEKEEHPDVAASMNTIPNNCLVCHSKSAAKSLGTEPFASMLHKIHLVGGEENHFITSYGGQCTYCHALNKETGEWTIKSGKE